ncbi:MAG: excinuclease ABC subunit UvrC [Anaerolineae bacterium]|nr:excinuclease ABC subunit UvrC [Thermoflexales bacterium]MDW8408546.1 excinuclease ABC subunit UvrC [Anaerolineae bacterium]
MSVPEHLDATVRSLPTEPGCYLFYDANGKVIYVGKAVNLRNRVRSYFNPNVWLASPKIGRLVRDIARIEFVVRGNELEALIQEAELIKRHQPRYNVRLKDDKRYPYLKVTLQDDFPTVRVTRRMERDGARYFGPFSDTRAVYATRDALRRMFPFLDCDRVITGQDKRACMYHDIKLCSAPCIGAISRAEYRATIQRLCDFLEGKSDQVLVDLQARMEQAAENLQFERAAWYRDQLKAARHVVEKQRVVSSAASDQDVIAFARADGEACVQVLFIRGGKLLGQEYFVLDGAEGADETELLRAFLQQFYGEAAYVPPEVLLPAQIDEAVILENWLKRKRGSAVRLRTPRGETDAGLVELAAQNAAATLTSLKAQWQEDSHRQESALRELQDALGLPRLPGRIECYDVSNTQGVAVVGSMVVFAHGQPRKSDYRRFNIRGLPGPNDFESLRQMLTRRFQRWQDTQDTSGTEQPADRLEVNRRNADAVWRLLPDLIIIDGGKGQLGVAVEVLEQFDLLHIVPVISLAKQQEEIFMPGKLESIMLPRQSQAFYLVQRIRDEAHRYGLSGHRRQREKISLASQLDAIPGVGPVRRRKLLRVFGSIEGMKAATVEQLAEHVPLNVARSIKDIL